MIKQNKKKKIKYKILGLHLQVSLDCSGAKWGYTIRELQTVFGKLQIEIINFIENCISNFWMIKHFSFRIALLD